MLLFYLSIIIFEALFEVSANKRKIDTVTE